MMRHRPEIKEDARITYAISRCPPKDFRLDKDALINTIFCEFHVINDRPEGCVYAVIMNGSNSVPRDVEPRLGLTIEKGILGGVSPL
jgi:hypothetical protein